MDFIRALNEVPNDARVIIIILKKGNCGMVKIVSKPDNLFFYKCWEQDVYVWTM